MKKTFTFILALIVLTIVGASAQNNNGVSTNTNANANANANATGGGSTIPGDTSIFGNGFWNVYCYNGNIITQPFKVVYYGYYTENNLSFDSKTRWANTGVPSNANSSSGLAYSGLSPLNLKHSVSYKRTGIAAGVYNLIINNNDDEAALIINGKQVWTRGFSASSQSAWTGYIDETSIVEFRWINVALTSNASLTFVPVVALPVEIANFEATVENNSVQLNWGTASEKNALYFIVEKTSAISKETTAVKKIVATGNSSSLSNYNVTDSNPTQGTAYYRIKSVDVNGTVQYSEFVSVSFDNSSEVSMEVYPNPTSSQNINIALSNVSSNATIMLIDAMGNTVYTQNSSSNNFSLNTVASILPGVYQVVATINNETISKRLIVQ